ncbi:KIR protein [Plasmodium knowlesi strain H]|uniref:KIR protein n=3 Tax=Plasmodium knowlesi TaxID=5850 RepID=A0A5K1V551_PLAKH|nr:KIR protein [Plasmodium knowlesi strain H]OTN68199.1 KIR protein [Plasmodium knowlesi]CAA9987101.1 KIR protein [Plasmodium knowlesi strain H]SBO25626.1 KIR protein [Plasmodium knowlesi strain H]VVS76575.1 KIR protein [Plasmodium knowlesi strain H]|eukprot:XP_002261723.1 kir protein [Plasmodium knowlesi strain H]
MADYTTILPSEQKYKIFGMRESCAATYGDQNKNENIVQRVGETVGLWTRAENYARKIVEAYCHASTETVTDSTHYYEPCYFFYFWLGDLLKDKFKRTNLDLNSVMGPAYIQLGKFQFKNAQNKRKCENLYEDIGKNVFDQRKIIFDYAYNHRTLHNDSREEKEFLCSTACAQYVKSAGDAYSSAIGACGSDASGDKFCQELKTEYSKYFDNNHKPKWKCTPVTEEESENEEEEDDDDDDNPLLNIAVLEESKLSQLPSRTTYYTKFDQGRSICEEGGDWTWVNQLKVALAEDSDIGENAEKIAKGLCYVQKMGDPPSENNKYCDFYYFWVGSILRSKFKDNSFFKKIMNKIKEDVEAKGGTDHKCYFKFPMKRKSYFYNSKLLLDYYKDKDDMKSHLEKNGDGVVAKCSDPYYKYFLHAHKAYNYMKSKCGNGDKQSINNEWCAKFKEIYGDCSNGGEDDGKSHCEVAVDSLKSCIEDSKPETMDTTSSSTANNTGSVTTGVVAGSTLATVGLPAIGFFLYKYTDVFDGIKKSIFGGLNNTGGRNRNRGRSSTIRHTDHHFDGFDSSTIGDDGSTTLGGGGGGSSTLGGSSTDVSTIYNEPPRRPIGRGERAGTNNRRPGNIRYYAT